MPSKSPSQHRLMEAVAHSPSFAKKVGIPTKVGKDFANADKDKRFNKGGLHLSVGGNKALPDSKKITPKGHVRYNNKTGNW